MIYEISHFLFIFSPAEGPGEEEVLTGAGATKLTLGVEGSHLVPLEFSSKVSAVLFMDIGLEVSSLISSIQNHTFNSHY